jgi:hypothetical protein
MLRVSVRAKVLSHIQQDDIQIRLQLTSNWQSLFTEKQKEAINVKDSIRTYLILKENPFKGIERGRDLGMA